MERHSSETDRQDSLDALDVEAGLFGPPQDERVAAADAAGLTLGAWLAAARRARGLSLHDIAGQTKVRPGILEAIEADRHDLLPAPTYTLGFVKAFARAVGVDAGAAAERYRAVRADPAPAIASAVVQLEEARLPRPLLVLGSTLALAALAGLLWSLGQTREGEQRPAPLALAAPASAPAPAAPARALVPGPGRSEPAPELPMLAPAPLPAAPGGAWALRATDEVWLRVRSAEGVTLFEGVLAAGQTLDLPADSQWRLRTGRAGALVPVVGGRALAPLGGPAEQLRDVALDPAGLAARPA